MIFASLRGIQQRWQGFHPAPSWAWTMTSNLFSPPLRGGSGCCLFWNSRHGSWLNPHSSGRIKGVMAWWQIHNAIAEVRTGRAYRCIYIACLPKFIYSIPQYTASTQQMLPLMFWWYCRLSRVLSKEKLLIQPIGLYCFITELYIISERQHLAVTDILNSIMIWSDRLVVHGALGCG